MVYVLVSKDDMTLSILFDKNLPDSFDP